MHSVRERFARGAADAEAEAEKKKSDEAKRKNKSKKGEAKKYYAVAVGLKTGLFTTWDECERQVNRVPNCLFKGFKRKSDAQAWLWKNRRQPLLLLLVLLVVSSRVARLPIKASRTTSTPMLYINVFVYKHIYVKLYLYIKTFIYTRAYI